MPAAGAPAGDGSPTRVLLFTGKGGVGKTTTAAATALRCADAGLRTLALSTDPAHSLADVFGVPLGPLVAPIADNLWGQQLDAQDRMEEAWEDIRRWLLEVFRWDGVEGLEAEELSVVPGLVPALKARVSSLTLAQCRALAERALRLDSAEAVRQLAREVLP